jgi:hypothetical protein
MAASSCELLLCVDFDPVGFFGVVARGGASGRQKRRARRACARRDSGAGRGQQPVMARAAARAFTSGDSVANYFGPDDYRTHDVFEDDNVLINFGPRAASAVSAATPACSSPSLSDYDAGASDCASDRASDCTSDRASDCASDRASDRASDCASDCASACEAPAKRLRRLLLSEP